MSAVRTSISTLAFPQLLKISWKETHAWSLEFFGDENWEALLLHVAQGQTPQGAGAELVLRSLAPT